MGYTIVAHGILVENDEGLHLVGGGASPILHGAQIRKFAKELLVDMVDEVEVLVADAIPPGAFDVWITGRVIETVVYDPPGSDKLFLTVSDAASSGSTEYTSDSGNFGIYIPLEAGSTWGVEGVFVTDHWEGGYEANNAGTPGTSAASNPRWFFPGGADVHIAAGGQDFVSGQVRLVIFYSILTSPTS